MGKTSSFERNFRKAYAAVEPAYAPRFLTQDQLVEITNLYHLARTAVSDKADRSQYARIKWAAAEFNKLHPTVSYNAAYKDLSNSLA